MWLETLCAEIPWMNLFLASGFILLAVYLYRIHTGQSKFSFDDLFLDRYDRADLYKVILASMAVLSVWAVVKLLLSDKPIETLLLGVLGIFVGGRAVSAFSSRTDDPKPVIEEGTK